MFNEEVWSNAESTHIAPYAKSKTLAERAAWDFQKKLPANERFEIVTICPGMVVGPTLIPGEFSSGQIVAG
jgi:dihydroflavonol-4-reductase